MFMMNNNNTVNSASTTVQPQTTETIKSSNSHTFGRKIKSLGKSVLSFFSPSVKGKSNTALSSRSVKHLKQSDLGQKSIRTQSDRMALLKGKSSFQDSTKTKLTQIARASVCFKGISETNKKMLAAEALNLSTGNPEEFSEKHINELNEDYETDAHNLISARMESAINETGKHDEQNLEAKSEASLDKLLKFSTKSQLVDAFINLQSQRAEAGQSLLRNTITESQFHQSIAEYEQEEQDIRAKAKTLQDESKPSKKPTEKETMNALTVGLFTSELEPLNDSFKYAITLLKDRNRSGAADKMINAAVDLVRDPNSRKKMVAYQKASAKLLSSNNKLLKTQLKQTKALSMKLNNAMKILSIQSDQINAKTPLSKQADCFLNVTDLMQETQAKLEKGQILTTAELLNIELEVTKLNSSMLDASIQKKYHDNANKTFWKGVSF